MFPFEIVYMFFFMLGSIMSLVSSSWLGVWLGLELNLFGLMPIFCFNKQMGEVESAVMYFIVQSIGSSIMLFSVLIDKIWVMFSFVVLMLSVMIKLGVGPFYFWLPKVMVGLNWFNCFIFSTWQKVVPLILFCFLVSKSFIGILVSLMSVMVGSMGGVNQKYFRVMMAYSSLVHLGWLMLSGMVSWLLMMAYLLVYSLVSFFIFFELKNTDFNLSKLIEMGNSEFQFCQFFLFLTLGGVPPFFLFFFKVLILCVYSKMVLVLGVLILASIVSLYYYMIMGFSSCIVFKDFGWLSINLTKFKKSFFFFFLLNLLGLMMFIMIF